MCVRDALATAQRVISCVRRVRSTLKVGQQLTWKKLVWVSDLVVPRLVAVLRLPTCGLPSVAERTRGCLVACCGGVNPTGSGRLDIQLKSVSVYEDMKLPDVVFVNLVGEKDITASNTR